MRLISSILILSSLLCLSCAPKQDVQKTDAPEQSVADVQKPVNPDEVILSAGDILLTLDDYAQCLTMHKFLGLDYSERALANPRFQRDEIQRCYQNRFMKQFAEKSHVEVKPAMKRDALRQAFEKFGVQDKEIVSVRLDTARPLIFGDVVVRVNDNFALAMHIDTDESNAACAGGDCMGEIVK